MFFAKLFSFLLLTVFVVLSHGLAFNSLKSLKDYSSLRANDLNRHKREAPLTCCGINMDESEESEEGDDACLKEIVGENFDKEDIMLDEKQLYTSRKKKLPSKRCFLECKYGLTNDEGEIDEKLYYELLEEDEESEAYIKDLSKKSFKKCVKLAEMHKPKVMKKYSDLKCNPITYDFITCMGVEVFLNCPAEKMKDDHENCTEITQALRKTFE